MPSKRYQNRLRCVKLVSDRDIVVIYPCFRYRGSSLLKEYRVLPDRKDCVKYIRLDRRCDIISPDIICSLI